MHTATPLMIHIDEIDIPEGRDIDPDQVERLAMSFQMDGQFHPIGVRAYTEKEIATDPGKAYRVELVHGRHRLAAAQRLGWTQLESKFMEDGRPGTTQSATDAENVIRAQLNPAEEIAAMSRWEAAYEAAYGVRIRKKGRPSGASRENVEALHGDAAGEGSEEGAGDGSNGETEDGGGTTETFATHATRKTGRPRSDVYKSLQAAKALTSDDLEIMSRHGVARRYILEVARLDPEERQKAISLIASGMKPREAIAHATLPEGAIVTVHPAGGEEPQRTEDELSDEDWIDTYCGDVLTRLSYHLAFKNDAILWRRTQAARKAFKDATLRNLSQGKATHTGSFHWKLVDLIHIDHPASWLPCGPCGGSGMTDNGKCSQCYGAAFKAGSSRRKTK